MQRSCAAFLWVAVALVTTTVGCGEEAEPVSLSAEGLEYEQRIDQAGMFMAAAGSLLAVTDLDYVECEGVSCVGDTTSLFRHSDERWETTGDVFGPDDGAVHILATNGETVLLGRELLGTTRVRFVEQRGTGWQTVLEVEDPGIRAGAIDGDRAVLARAVARQEAGEEVPLGSIQLYERQAGSWVEVASADTNDTTDAAWSRFGDTGVIAIHGHRVAVADPDTRRVHLFDRVALRYQEVMVFEAPFSDESHFGSAVALGDGRLAVGAPGVPGSVFIYTRQSREVWEATERVRASNADWFRDRGGFQVRGFGRAVALRGDLLVVGAPFEDSAASGVNAPLLPSEDPLRRRTGTGAVYVFERFDGDELAGSPAPAVVWQERYYIKVPGASSAFNELGHTVAIDGDRLWAGDNESVHVWRLVD